MARVLGLKQLLQKKYHFLDNLPEDITASFGRLTDNFTMLVWGISGNGKSNFIMQFMKVIMFYGKVLYIALEEGFEATTQFTADRNLTQELHSGRIEFADHNMTYDALIEKLKKKKSPRFIIIDSIQYWNITYEQYKRLKEIFKRKTFIFISHASGKIPDGKVADKIRYDAGIKVRLEGFIGFIICRYGGNKPFIVWEAGAKKYWGKKYRNVITGIKSEIPTKPKTNENASLPPPLVLEESGKSLVGERPKADGIVKGLLPHLAGGFASEVPQSV